jgi:hypothetical protein
MPPKINLGLCNIENHHNPDLRHTKQDVFYDYKIIKIARKVFKELG